MLQEEFQIPEVYGTDTVIKKPNASASFLGVSLGPNKKRIRAARSLIFLSECAQGLPKFRPNNLNNGLLPYPEL